MRPFLQTYILTVFAIIFCSGCHKKDKNKTPQPDSYSIPSTYNFDNVDISEQKTQISMLDELLGVIDGGKDTPLDSSKLQTYYSNTGAPFSADSLNNSGTSLVSATFDTLQAYFRSYLDSVVVASSSGKTASNGVAGIAVSANGNEKFLLAANGFDYQEMIEKAGMGGILYYQATANYLSDNQIGDSVDNSNVTTGKGTAMQHHWDEAYGCLGFPSDFPNHPEQGIFWGEYAATVMLSNAGTDLQNAFIKGRAAIDNQDMDTKNKQRTTIFFEWEKLIAAAAIHELNEAKKNITDNAVRNHNITEAIGFILSFKYNPSKSINDVQIQNLLSVFGNNLYTIQETSIDQTINQLSSLFGLDSVKSSL